MNDLREQAADLLAGYVTLTRIPSAFSKLLERFEEGIDVADHIRLAVIMLGQGQRAALDILQAIEDPAEFERWSATYASAAASGVESLTSQLVEALRAGLALSQRLTPAEVSALLLAGDELLAVEIAKLPEGGLAVVTTPIEPIATALLDVITGDLEFALDHGVNDPDRVGAVKRYLRGRPIHELARAVVAKAFDRQHEGESNVEG